MIEPAFSRGLCFMLTALQLWNPAQPVQVQNREFNFSNIEKNGIELQPYIKTLTCA